MIFCSKKLNSNDMRTIYLLITLIGYIAFILCYEKKFNHEYSWCSCVHNNAFIEYLLSTSNQYQRSVAICICGGLRFHYENRPYITLRNTTFSRSEHPVQKPIAIRSSRISTSVKQETSLPDDNLDLSTLITPYKINISTTLLPFK